MTDEVWKDIVGYEGLYQVSTLGRVKSCARVSVRRSKLGNLYMHIQQEYMFVPIPDSLGYIQVRLRRDHTSSKVRVHRLVALAFLENPLNLPQVNHKNGVKIDNVVSNLEWCSASENTIHAYALGLLPSGERHYNAKLTSQQAGNILRLKNLGLRAKAISQEAKIPLSRVKDVYYGKTWKHVKEVTL